MKSCRDKIEFQFAVPNVRRTYSKQEESRFRRDRQNNRATVASQLLSRKFYTNFSLSHLIDTQTFARTEVRDAWRGT